jgi:uncharacterized membrane-anchored protein YjiN (DUF445 family)
MTVLMQKALEVVNQLSEEEQDKVAQWLLAELNAEQRWQTLFDQSADMLSELAEEALSEHKHGETLALDIDNL